MSDQLLNVCLVAPLPPQQNTNSHSCGGIATWTRRICSYAKDRNDIKLTVIDTLPRLRSVHTLPLWKRVINGGYELILTIVQLFWSLSTQPIDIIHLTTSGKLGIVRDISIMFVARLFKKPVIYHIRYGRIPKISEEKTREWRMMSIAIMKAHTVIAIDKATRDTIKIHLPMANSVLIPNCINLSDLPSFNVSKPLQKIVLFAGWVIPTKGVTELIEAWSQIKQDGWSLQLIGPGDKTYQQELIEKYQTENVQFLGEIPHNEVMESMAACDLFVLPSYTEGFPNVVLEAMTLGKPILASDVGAIPEMLDGECGKLIKPKNVQSLREAIVLLLNDKNLRDEMGKRANKKVMEQYTIDVVFASYMTIWHKALAKDVKNNCFEKSSFSEKPD